MAELRAITGGAITPQVRRRFASLAAALATERFAATLLQAIGTIAGCDRCYVFEQDGPDAAPSLFAARVPEPVIGPMVEAYRRQYFRTDPVSRSFRDPAARNCGLLLTVEPPDLPDTQYRRLCFERTGIVPRQDLFGIAIGSCDFYNPEGGYTEETPYVNSPELLRQVIPRVHAMGSVVEFEVVEASMLHKLRRLADGGLFDPVAANLWLLHGGGFGATPPLARNVIFSIDEGQRLFPNARWGVTATGRDQFPICTLGLAMGCDSVRVGFEDNIYRPDGTAARHNHDLVADMVAIARLFGRDPATPAEARAILGLRTGG